MLKRRFYISLAFLCVVHAENTVYPTTVHQQGDTQTIYHGSNQVDHDDHAPAQSQSYRVVENPVYDKVPTELIPQDAIQQYITHNANNPQTGAYPPIYYPHTDQTGGFTIQSGYEGYLVPSYAAQQPAGVDYLRTLMPSTRTFFSYFRRLVYYLIQTFGYVLAGGSVTAVVCAVTPFCRLTFLGLPFLRMKESAKTITETLANEITEERVKRAAELVKMALEKYQYLQTEEEEEPEKVVKKIQ